MEKSENFEVHFIHMGRFHCLLLDIGAKNYEVRSRSRYDFVNKVVDGV